jgi:predicted secreted protein
MLPLASAMVETTILSKSVKCGETFDITLHTNPSTGYTWMIHTLPSVCRLISTKGAGIGKFELVYERFREAGMTKTEVIMITVQ